MHIQTLLFLFIVDLVLVLRPVAERAIGSHYHMQCEKQETGCLDLLSPGIHRAINKG
jgi:hypothetical protein